MLAKYLGIEKCLPFAVYFGVTHSYKDVSRELSKSGSSSCGCQLGLVDFF
jgi:hypothetical protein